jgi:hypothetical protein
MLERRRGREISTATASPYSTRCRRPLLLELAAPPFPEIHVSVF